MRMKNVLRADVEKEKRPASWSRGRAKWGDLIVCGADPPSNVPIAKPVPDPRIFALVLHDTSLAHRTARQRT